MKNFLAASLRWLHLGLWFAGRYYYRNKGVHHLIHSLIYMAYSLSIIGICMVTWLLSSSSTGRKRTARLASI